MDEAIPLIQITIYCKAIFRYTKDDLAIFQTKVKIFSQKYLQSFLLMEKL